MLAVASRGSLGEEDAAWHQGEERNNTGNNFPLSREGEYKSAHQGGGLILRPGWGRPGLIGL